jgi:uncharacterized membrane protein
MKTTLLILGVLIALSPMTHAAVITGTTYDGLTLDVLPNTIVTINTTPAQTKLVKDGQYSFEVPIGKYTLKGTYLEQGIVVQEALHTLNVEKDGTYTVDLILLPDLGNIPDEPLPDDEPPLSWIEQVVAGPVMWLLLLGIVLAGAGYAILQTKRHTQTRYAKEEETKDSRPTPDKEVGEEIHLDRYAIEVLNDLKRGGNRLTQKELRSMINIGEAKVSLVVSEMETYGLIKKIKKGRGNILILTEKGREELEKQSPAHQTEEKKEPGTKT